MSVASKNLFAYLGNDDDGEEKPVVPVKTVDKTSTRTSKRTEGPAAPTRGNTNRRGPSGSEGAFRDRGVGSDRNRARGTDEQPANRGPRGGSGARVRGGRGSGRPRDRDDRQSRNAPPGVSDKQTNASWGAQEGEAELKDEQAAEAIADADKKEALVEDAAGDETPAEPEDKSVSYADYLAQQAEKKLGLGDLNLRTANEGSKLDKKWQNAKALENDEEEYFAATGGKKIRERERKVKQTVDFDPRYVESDRPRGGRGGRGGERGGGRGGRGGERGERGARGNFRGGRGGQSAAPINTKDTSAFPSLGGN